MKLPQPSLVRRLTLAFMVSHAIALTLFVVALWPVARAEEDGQVGPDVAISLIRKDVFVEEGALALRRGPQLLELIERAPELWFIVEGEQGTLHWGTVPQQVPEIAQLLLGVVKTAELGQVGAPGRSGDVAIVTSDTEAGRLLIAAGGVPAEAITFPMWVAFLARESYLLMPLGTALFTLVGGLIAIPVVLRSLRSTAVAAASIDESDLQRRLPEEGVVSELLPIVRAFNAALDRLTDALERRRRFIADLAHELRTPLAVLSMHVDELPPGAKKPELQRTTYRLSEMVGQMLDAERLALAGRKRQPVDLVSLGREITAEVAPLAISNGYEIGFAAASEQLVIDGDRHALGRALANLLGNAIAHGGGSGTIELRVIGDGAIEVSDEGAGISPEAAERIFEPFHRERWDRDGCGLGLHLVREIMKAHGGNARLVSTAAGARFRLEFPLRNMVGEPDASQEPGRPRLQP